MSDIEILSEKVLFQRGSYKKIQRWLRGVHPECGKIVRGFTGWETMCEVDIIKPSANAIFEVADGQRT